MVDAGLNAHLGGFFPQRFRDFQFLFSILMIHEVGGHLMVSWLGHGRVETPPRIAVTGYTRHERPDVGEAGRHLEYMWFGGCLEFFYDPELDHYQAGMPYLRQPDGTHWRITQSVVNDVCARRFSFPFEVSYRGNRAAMWSMGQEWTESMHGSGPIQQIMSHRAEIDQNVRCMQAHDVDQDELRLIPQNPSRFLHPVRNGATRDRMR